MAERILIVQLADIGDLILATPALAALREAHPGAHLALLTTAHAAPVIAGTVLVDEVITFERQAFNSSRAFFRPANLRRILALRGGRWGAVVFLHHFTLRLGTLKFALIGLASGARRRIGLENGNGWFLTERLADEGFGVRHQAQYWLDLVGLLGATATPRRTQVHIEQAASLPDVSGSIVIHAGSGGYSLARRWDAAQFAAVADALHAETGKPILLVGGKGDDTQAVRDAMRAPVLDLSGQTTLPQLAGVLSRAALFIGADSGVMHLAAAVGVPVLAIFGPSNPDAWGPWQPGGRVAVVRSAPECSPCSYVGHSIGLREGCPARTCMRMVTAAQVVAAARGLLNGEEPHPQPLSGGRGEMPNSEEPHPQPLSEGRGEMLIGNEEPNPLVMDALRRGDLPGRPYRDTPPTTGQPASAPLRFNSLDSPRRIRILGLPVDAITYAEWLDRIEGWVQGEAARHVCTINPEFVMIAQRDTLFHAILSRAALCVPDGVGLLWAARRLGTPLPERVTGSDGVPKIAERAAARGWRLFLLGAAPGVADKAADVLRAHYPGVQICGVYGGSPAADEEDAIVERINASGADILFVAYGAPVQDKWIARNLPRLNVKMAMGVGGALDFIAGVVPRAPEWMQRLGLEWLFRLYLQPWRIGRMLRLPRFVLAVLWRGRV
ncbi:MAG: WecB/TagA/CpsF family glycosyltransferase [Anaerolineae bacterium]|nr:WecB/TagA/CpsF family glycosyltransferase [Anaerolineae bacterium]